MNIKKILVGIASGVLMLGVMITPAFASTPNWDVSGSWVFDYNDGNINLHDMTLTQDATTGALSGFGGAFSGSLPYTYPWTITTGFVDGNTITFTADYTATVTCSFTATGTIAVGTMSGIWTDNCVLGGRSGTWVTESGTAVMLPRVYTKPATGVFLTSATLNGTNGSVDANGKSFWMGPTLPAIPFYAADTDTTVTQLQNWYSVSGDYDSLIANADFSFTRTGLTTNTTYYFVAWSFVGGIWYPGEILSFITGDLIVGPPIDKNQCKKDGWKIFNNPSFKNQGQCEKYVENKKNDDKKCIKEWNVAGSYDISVRWEGIDYPETLVLTQSGTNITGTSLDTIPSSSYFTVTGGFIIGNVVNIYADNGSPYYHIHMEGTIDANGAIKGSWHDESPGTRTGTWGTTTGKAVLGKCEDKNKDKEDKQEGRGRDRKEQGRRD